MTTDSPLFMFEHHLDGVCRAGMFFFALANCGVEVRCARVFCVPECAPAHGAQGFGAVDCAWFASRACLVIELCVFLCRAVSAVYFLCLLPAVRAVAWSVSGSGPWEWSNGPWEWSSDEAQVSEVGAISFVIWGAILFGKAVGIYCVGARARAV